MKGVGSVGVVAVSIAPDAGGVCVSSAILRVIFVVDWERWRGSGGGSERYCWETRFDRGETRRDEARA